MGVRIGALLGPFSAYQSLKTFRYTLEDESFFGVNLIQ